MARYINADKFLDKLLYMGYMDEQKSEVEEVANKMTEEAYTKDEVIAKLQDIRARAWMHHSKFDDDRDFEVDRAIEDIVWLVDIEIGKLKEQNITNHL